MSFLDECNDGKGILQFREQLQEGYHALHKYLIERGVVSWFRENEVVMDNLITVFETWQLIMGMGQVSLCSDVFFRIQIVKFSKWTCAVAIYGFHHQSQVHKLSGGAEYNPPLKQAQALMERVLSLDGGLASDKSK